MGATCSMAKIRAHQNDRSSSFPVAAKRIGERVSSDVKSVPFESFEGYRYVVNFVDHHSRLGICYFMRHKSEVSACVKRSCAELAYYCFRVGHWDQSNSHKKANRWPLRYLLQRKIIDDLAK